MSLNGINADPPDRRLHVVRWVIRLLVALIVSAIIVFLFFTTGAVSH